MSHLDKCPYMTENKIGSNQSAYSASALLRHSGAQPQSLDRLNGIKNICLDCPLDECVYIKARIGVK